MERNINKGTSVPMCGFLVPYKLPSLDESGQTVIVPFIMSI